MIRSDSLLYIETICPKTAWMWQSYPYPYLPYTQKHPHASKVMMHKFLETLTFISYVSLDTQSIYIYSQYIQSIYEVNIYLGTHVNI